MYTDIYPHRQEHLHRPNILNIHKYFFNLFNKFINLKTESPNDIFNFVHNKTSSTCYMSY